ncbi:progonadoliberin-1-like [Plectropomus leopardus]|uniref:progonadoliberin-1-like n=1 Tax=Plectropomus leopardus TaxID=160734 RepID=UPI001C4B8DAA|nr:progonadoliberin-1-like [Plectropomus leopardus]
MASKSLALWLLLVGAVLSQGHCQHWSYGLHPGGKRDVDSLSDTPGNIIEGFAHLDTPCSVFGCAEESPLAKIYGTKGFLGSVSVRENGRGTYKK